MKAEKLTSNERLNKHKIESNKICSAVDNCLYQITKKSDNEIHIENIVKVYIHKIYEIYTTFEQEKLDFWEENFALRNPIITELNSYMTIGALLTENIKNDLESSNPVLFKKTLKKAKIINLQPKIETLNTIISFIHNYDIKNNINDTIIEYYYSLPINFMSSNQIKEKHQRIKECIKVTNLEDYINEEELDIIIEDQIRQSTKNKKTLTRTR